jgi:1-acyl-sn-glycerol-3-phosphate acyltransferase
MVSEAIYNSINAMIYAVGRFLLRLVTVVDLVLATLVMYLAALVPGLSGSGTYHGWFRTWSRVFARALGVDLRLRQMNREPLPERYILIANHPSAFEDIGIPALFPVYSVAKKEVAQWWVVGRISTAAGTIYFDREEKGERKALPERMVKALEEGKNLAIYPEGGCKGRRIQERFLFGAFDVSMRSGIPIVPVFLHYEAQEDFEWLGQSLLRKIWEMATSRNPRANYYVFDAISPRDFSSKEEMTEQVHARYLEWQARYLE